MGSVHMISPSRSVLAAGVYLQGRAAPVTNVLMGVHSEQMCKSGANRIRSKINFRSRIAFGAQLRASNGHTFVKPKVLAHVHFMQKSILYLVQMVFTGNTGVFTSNIIINIALLTAQCTLTIGNDKGRNIWQMRRGPKCKSYPCVWGMQSPYTNVSPGFK